MTAVLLTFLFALGAEPAENLNCLTPEECAQAALDIQLLQQLQSARDRRSTPAPAELADQVRALLGIAPLSELPTPTGVDLGRIQRATYHIDRLVLKTPTSVLPGLTFHPKEPRAGAY
ncbi:MAG: hypothetical protein U0992_22975, partial [Planctomycetaceae bacterium]